MHHILPYVLINQLFNGPGPEINLGTYLQTGNQGKHMVVQGKEKVATWQSQKCINVPQQQHGLKQA
jgi:hypothetical protein